MPKKWTFDLFDRRISRLRIECLLGGHTLKKNYRRKSEFSEQRLEGFDAYIMAKKNEYTS